MELIVSAKDWHSVFSVLSKSASSLLKGIYVIVCWKYSSWQSDFQMIADSLLWINSMLNWASDLTACVVNNLSTAAATSLSYEMRVVVMMTTCEEQTNQLLPSL
jgi:hypothetical protein